MRAAQNQLIDAGLHHRLKVFPQHPPHNSIIQPAFFHGLHQPRTCTCPDFHVAGEALHKTGEELTLNGRLRGDDTDPVTAGLRSCRLDRRLHAHD